MRTLLPILLWFPAILPGPLFADSDERGPKLESWRFKGRDELPIRPSAVSDVPVRLSELSISPDGRVVAAPVADGVGIFDGETLELRHTIPIRGYLKTIQCTSSKVIVQQGRNISAHQHSGEPVWTREVENVSRLDVSPNGNRVALQRMQGKSTILNAESGEPISEAEIERDFVFVTDRLILSRSHRQKVTCVGVETGVARPVPLDFDCRGYSIASELDSGRVFWVHSRTGEVRVTELDGGASKVEGSCPPNFGRWLHSLRAGFAAVVNDEQGRNLVRYRRGRVDRLEISSARFDLIRFDAAGEKMLGFIPHPGVLRGQRLAIFDLTRPVHSTLSESEPGVFLKKKGLVQFGLRTTKLRSTRWVGEWENSDSAWFSRTHKIDGNLLTERATLRTVEVKRLANQVSHELGMKFEFSTPLRVVDGGQYIYKVETFETYPKATITVMSKSGSRVGSFEASQFTRLGSDGRSYTIQEIRNGSEDSEVLVARTARGSKSWELADVRVRPVDVDPGGEFVAVETGILTAKKGEWVARWPAEDIVASPRFDSSSKYAVVALRDSDTECRWVFFDLEDEREVAFATFPLGAEPVDVSPDGKHVMVRFGPFGIQRLFRRR